MEATVFLQPDVRSDSIRLATFCLLGASHLVQPTFQGRDHTGARRPGSRDQGAIIAATFPPSEPRSAPVSEHHYNLYLRGWRQSHAGQCAGSCLRGCPVQTQGAQKIIAPPLFCLPCPTRSSKVSMQKKLQS